MTNNYLLCQLTTHLYLLKQYLVLGQYVLMGIQNFLQDWFQFQN